MELFANVRIGIAALLALMTAPLWAQSGSITGTITGPSGDGIASAQVSIKNTASGQTATTKADTAGVYLVPNLGPGDYEVSVSAEGFDTQTSKVTLAAGAQQRADMLLRSGGAAPSLKDLGFTPDQSQGSAQNQALLDKRSHMLKVHQRLGLITAAPLLATIITSNGAAGRHGTQSGRDLHATLGGITATMYLTSAGFAMFAPKVPGTTAHGQIRWHKALAWVHGPGMILTPVLGAMAFDQRNKGEKVHGIASAHGVVAATTAVAYGLAILSVSVKF